MKKNLNFKLLILFIGIITVFSLNAVNAQTEVAKAPTIQTDGVLTCTFTQTVSGATKNVIAVWIEDNSGNFVRTRAKYTNEEVEHLPTWRAKSSQNVVDAITGATLTGSSNPTAFGSKTITWNGKTGAIGSFTTVNDGDYKVWVETAWANGTPSNQHGDIQSFVFTKGTSTDHRVVASAGSYFTNITLDWVPAAVTTFEVTSSVYPVGGGNVTGVGSFNQNASCTLTAVPNANYTFVNWTNGVNVVSTSNPYTFTVSAATNLTANFSLANKIDESKTNSINIYPNPSKGNFNIKFDKDYNSDVTVQVYSIGGKLVLSDVIENVSSGNIFNIDLSEYHAGIYQIKIIADNRVVFKPIIIL